MFAREPGNSQTLVAAGLLRTRCILAMTPSFRAVRNHHPTRYVGMLVPHSPATSVRRGSAHRAVRYLQPPLICCLGAGGSVRPCSQRQPQRDRLRLTAGPRDGLLYVPGSYPPERAFPLLLLLHGAGGNAHEIIARMIPLAEAARVIILAPDSRGRTWDVLLSGFGADITAIDEALDWTFERCAVDRRHVAIGGFSDGASYALSVGLANGDLFTHILAFSPGFLEPPAIVGRPRIFVSHGTQDEILPIDVTSRAFVPRLEGAGYRVRYREFEGPHTVPADVAREALEWFSGRG